MIIAGALLWAALVLSAAGQQADVLSGNHIADDASQEAQSSGGQSLTRDAAPLHGQLRNATEEAQKSLKSAQTDVPNQEINFILTPLPPLPGTKDPPS